MQNIDIGTIGGSDPFEDIPRKSVSDPNDPFADIPKKKQGILSKLDNFTQPLTIPEQKSREGLTMLTDAITPSMEDIEAGKVGIPGIAARTAGETLAEVAPSFVSRGSILTAGLAKGVKASQGILGSIGKGIGSMAEKASGLANDNPGVLAKEFDEPLKLFKGGIERASQLYKQLVANNPTAAASLEEELSARKFVAEAYQLAKNGQLGPTEALEARQTLEKISDRVPGMVYGKFRDVFNSIAKPVFAEADALHQQGKEAAAMWSVLPIDKAGNPNLFKAGAAGVAARYSPMPLKVAIGMATSPLAQSLAAGGLGTAYKIAKPLINNPELGLMARPLSDQLQEEYQKRRGKHERRSAH